MFFTWATDAGYLLQSIVGNSCVCVCIAAGRPEQHLIAADQNRRTVQTVPGPAVHHEGREGPRDSAAQGENRSLARQGASLELPVRSVLSGADLSAVPVLSRPSVCLSSDPDHHHPDGHQQQQVLHREEPPAEDLRAARHAGAAADDHHPTGRGLKSLSPRASLYLARADL